MVEYVPRSRSRRRASLMGCRPPKAAADPFQRRRGRPPGIALPLGCLPARACKPATAAVQKAWSMLGGPRPILGGCNAMIELNPVRVTHRRPDRSASTRSGGIFDYDRKSEPGRSPEPRTGKPGRLEQARTRAGLGRERSMLERSSTASDKLTGKLAGRTAGTGRRDGGRRGRGRQHRRRSRRACERWLPSRNSGSHVQRRQRWTAATLVDIQAGSAAPRPRTGPTCCCACTCAGANKREKLQDRGATLLAGEVAGIKVGHHPC